MKTVSARQANHQFFELLSRVEHGEEISPANPPWVLPLFAGRSLLRTKLR